MALNGISTLSTKAARKIAKISLDVVERQLVGTNVFRVLNNYIGSVSPAISRPWQPAVLAIIDAPKTYGKSYNLGGAEKLTYRQLVERIAKKSKIRGK